MAEKPTVNELKQRIEDLKKELTERQIHDNSILEELDTRYSSIFESVPTSIVILDKNGVIIDINPYHITHIGQGKTVKKDYLNHDILNFPSVVEAGLQDEHRDVLNGKPMNLKRIHFPMTTGERDRFFNIRGVPLFKNNEVTGAVIIHEDISEVVSSEKNLKKLHDELELRIEERTAELKQEITERKQAEEIKKVLFAISNAVNFTRNLEDLFEIIHKTLGNIIDVTNFFIAMVDIKKRTLYFPYQVDTNDNDFFPITNFNTKNSLTGLVVSERRPILLKKNDLEKLSAQKGVWGPVPLIWMGAPLIVKDEIIGVVAVQSYLDSNLYNEQDLQVLSGIS
ncbi:MAG: GAF domain-containing protein, partial [Desulfobacula sp.]|nr:GAF domain-containing protein [Desulfobacula sp.]